MAIMISNEDVFKLTIMFEFIDSNWSAFQRFAEDFELEISEEKFQKLKGALL